MFKRAARCAYRAKFRAIKLRRWQRVCKSVMTKVEAKVSGKGNLSQSNLGYFCQELSCCQYFWMAVIAGCPGKVRADCIFCYSFIERPWMWDVKYNIPDCHGRIWSPSWRTFKHNFQVLFNRPGIYLLAWRQDVSCQFGKYASTPVENAKHLIVWLKTFLHMLRVQLQTTFDRLALYSLGSRYIWRE